MNELRLQRIPHGFREGFLAHLIKSRPIGGGGRKTVFRVRFAAHRAPRFVIEGIVRVVGVGMVLRKRSTKRPRRGGTRRGRSLRMGLEDGASKVRRHASLAPISWESRPAALS